jgi:acetyl-CoA carboxylase biotin carboxyl carrier protein
MTLDPALVATLSRWLDATDIDLLELSGPDGALTLGRGGVARMAVAEAGPTEVLATSPGLFLDRHPLAARAAVEVGEEVEAGELLGCLRVGTLLLPVRAPASGLVVAVLATPGALVGYGTPLFRLQPLPQGERP